MEQIERVVDALLGQQVWRGLVFESAGDSQPSSFCPEYFRIVSTESPISSRCWASLMP